MFVGAGTEDLSMVDWDPMMDDYMSIRNSYDVDVDDAGVALTGYSKNTSLLTHKVIVCSSFNQIALQYHPHNDSPVIFMALLNS